VVSEVAVNEVVLGPVDGLFQYVTVIEGDGKKKQPHKYSAALVTHVRSGIGSTTLFTTRRKGARAD